MITDLMNEHAKADTYAHGYAFNERPLPGQTHLGSFPLLTVLGTGYMHHSATTTSTEQANQANKRLQTDVSLMNPPIAIRTRLASRPSVSQCGDGG